MRNTQDIVLREQQRGEMAQYQPSAAQMPHNLAEPSIIRGILRNFWLVILFALVGGGIAYAYLRKVKPLYLSEAKIEISPTGPRVLSDTLGSAQRSNYLYTQAELIKGTPVLSIVASKPEIRSLPSLQNVRGDLAMYLRNRVEAEVGRVNALITVSTYAASPEDAAAIVNSAVQAYTELQLQERKTASSGLLGSLKNSKKNADDNLAKLEASITEFNKKHSDLKLDGLFQQELATIAAQWTQAQLNSLELGAGYMKDNPNVIRARQKEEQLANEYAKKRQLVMSLNVVQADWETMAAEQAKQKLFVNRLEERIKELEVNQGAEQIFNQVDILEPARAADSASFPRKNRTMAIAIVAGMLLGAGLALLRDRLDGRMRSVEEIQNIIGLPILGVVPAMTGRRTAIARAMAVHLDPRSPVSEAYRTIRTAVYFGATANRCKTILMTSPEPGDGKTTSASNLAIAIAQTGRSVLLLDADFRKPTQHKNLDIKDSVGLSSVLAGREPLERAIQHTGVEGLDILPCGPIPANPSEILNSREFGELIDSLAARYDHIIFDSPPVNPVTDARILSAVCDTTILVLRADKSTRKAGEHARNALMSVGARVMGAVVNDAPNRKGYEVYGGSYYGHSESRRSPAPALVRSVADAV